MDFSEPINLFWVLFLGIALAIVTQKGQDMSYKKDFDDAKKAGQVTDMTYSSFEFKAAGDSIIGELMDIQEVHFDKTDSDVNKYILKTDEGLQSIILGAIGDGQLKGRIRTGDIMRAEFIEKKDLPGGRTANIFTIQIIEREVEHGAEEDNAATTH